MYRKARRMIPFIGLSDRVSNIYEEDDRIFRQLKTSPIACRLVFFLVFQTAQIFGVLPVSEIVARNVRHVKFRWLRFKVLISMVVILGASLETILSVYRGLKVGIDMHVTG